MKPCATIPYYYYCSLIIIVLMMMMIIIAPSPSHAWSLPKTLQTVASTRRYMTTTQEGSTEAKTTVTVSVQVCGFKDCKRKGGGAKLEKFVQQVLEEEGQTSQFQVQGCDCLGECGYGPNLMVDDKLINNVRGRDAILDALGIPSSNEPARQQQQ